MSVTVIPNAALPPPPSMTQADSRQAGRIAEATYRRSILIVVRGNGSRKALRECLEQAGYAVMEAATGATAIALVKNQRPDLIVQDLILNDIDGLELARSLHAELGDTLVPILGISGFLSRLNEARATKSGVGQVLVKPVDLFQLLEIVQIHLAPPPAAVGREGEGRRLLVVDDDPRHRKLAEVAFSNAGFDVIVAADGATALQIARRELPDTIVSDVLMPRMDGYAFCLAVRRDPQLGTTRVILTSSTYVEAADRLLASKVGASIVIAKSDGFDAVISAIVHALRGPVPPAPIVEPVDLIEDNHAQRALWQLEWRAHRADRLLRRASLQETQLAVLAGVAEALAKDHSANVLGDVLAACLDMADVSKGALYLEDSGSLAFKYQSGFSDLELPGLHDLFGCRSVFSEVMAGGNVVLVPSMHVPPEVGKSLLDAAGLSSLLVVPVKWAGNTYGVMILGCATSDITSEDARAFAQVLGTQMGLAIGLTRSFSSLAASEHRYRTLTENANDAISILTRDGKICEVNHRLTELLGYSTEQLVGHDVREFEASGQEERNRRDSTQSIAIGGGRLPAIGIRKADGSVLQVDVSLSPVQVGSEQLILAIGRDGTEELQARALLMTADRMWSMGTLAAGVAHEINNPLAAVMGNLDVASDQVAELGDGPERSARIADLEETLCDAHEATRRVRDIVKDLRIFSRASEEGRQRVVNTERVLDSTLRMAATEIRHRARLVKEYGNVPCVMANESRLGQVFLNLIINAAQAIPEGAADINKITVTTSSDATGRVVVEIRDTGPGMAPDILKSLFTPFFTTKPAGVGTGLGLTICKRIVTEMGGEITAQSQVGRGTSFKVVLPAAARGETDDADEPRRVPARVTRRGRVLLVDDDDSIGRAVTRSLAGDHDLTVLSSARAALDRIAAGERYDVILCDMMMPVITGMEFYNQLRETTPKQADRIIFLTGGAFTVSAREFLDHVRNECIEKPFAAQALRAVVNDHVR